MLEKFKTDFESLSIKSMRFHIVGPAPKDSDKPIFKELKPVHFEPHSEFFKARIRDCLAGNLHYFDPDSDTLADLRSIVAGSRGLGVASIRLAKRFSQMHARQSMNGVFMLVKLQSDAELYFSLMKFDDQDVLGYREREGQTVLTKLQQTFVEDKAAMQKVAIARLSDSANVPLLVLERSDRKNGTDFFRRFLGASRKFEESELTKRLLRAVSKTKRELTGRVDWDLLRSANSRAAQYMRAAEGIEENDLSLFATAVFGTDGDGEVLEELHRQLRKQGISGESFSFDKSAVPEPRRKVIRTKEDISISYTLEQKDRISRSVDGADTLITIRTAGIVDDDAETD
jgi:hypothetical protein